jgi:hypothetical protein
VCFVGVVVVVVLLEVVVVGRARVVVVAGSVVVVVVGAVVGGTVVVVVGASVVVVTGGSVVVVSWAAALPENAPSRSGTAVRATADAATRRANIGCMVAAYGHRRARIGIVAVIRRGDPRRRAGQSGGGADVGTIAPAGADVD